ncbi:MAG: DUF4062 domain-containing protein [Verrucomicrobiota bacterium]
MRVFISSTCYDLIDLRAELDVFFREAGVTPILSDSLTSEFKVKPDRNSINTCLANVRSCNAFVIVLSNRYGPSLAKAGFDDVSATQLEYREAVHRNLPIHMYVRDRLNGEYDTWRNNRENPKLKLAWCKDRKDWKIFHLLEEHQRLAQDKVQNNWHWSFRNSVEFKQRLAEDFKETFDRVTATRLIESGRLPYLELNGRVSVHDKAPIQTELRFQNLGKAVAVGPVLEFDQRSYQLPSLAELQVTPVRWKCMHSQRSSIFNLTMPTRFSYSIPDGHKFTEEGSLTIYYDPRTPEHGFLRYVLTKRQYLGIHPEMLLT